MLVQENRIGPARNVDDRLKTVRDTEARTLDLRGQQMRGMLANLLHQRGACERKLRAEVPPTTQPERLIAVDSG